MTRCRIWLLALALVFHAIPGEARVIAILFDDSGSMGGKDNLPAFGAQLLASTLDGRNGEDKLITARMSDARQGMAGIVQHRIGTVEQHRRTIGTIRNWGAIRRSGTPHVQIEFLLRRIAAMQAENEEAFLIILTDGAFLERDRQSGQRILPTPEAFRASLAPLAQALRGPLRVEFLLIGPELRAADDNYRRTVRQMTEDQGIRRALLEIFNGDAADGKEEVSTADEMLEAIKSIIARTSSTERSEIDRYIRRDGNGIEIRSPLAIRRIISVSVNNADAEPATPDLDAVPNSDDFPIAASMRGTDSKLGSPDRRLGSVTTHVIFDPPLPAGSYRIPYDRPPDGVFLLFQTAMDLQLSLLDEAGTPIDPSADGIIRLRHNAKTTLAMTIHDGEGAQRRLVPPDAFDGNAAFRAYISNAAGQTPLRPRPRDGASDVRVPFPTDAVGSGKVDGSLRVRGFVSAYAAPLRYEVIDVAADIRIAASGSEACSDCGSDEISVTLSPDESEAQAATVRVTVDAPVAGGLTVALENAPQGVRLVRPGGRAADQVIPLAARQGQVFELKLMVSGQLLPQLSDRDNRLPLVVRAAAVAPVVGEASLARTLRLKAPVAKLVATGNSQDASGASPLRLDLGMLRSRTERLDFTFHNTVLPPRPEEVEIVSDSWFLRFDARTSGNDLTLVPRVRTLCECFLFFGQGDHVVSVAWRSGSGLQSAVSRTGFRTGIPFFWSGALHCAKLIGLVLLVFYLSATLIAFARAARFPRGSGLDVSYNNDDPIFRPFRTWTWSLPRALAWPVFGVPHQQERRENIVFEAQRGGANILLKRSDPMAVIETVGDSIREILETSPNLETVKVSWGDSVESKQFGRVLVTLLKDPSDRRRR